MMQMRYSSSVKKADIDAVSEFSRTFSRHLREWQQDHALTQVQIAAELERTQAWVSERLRGVRPVDTDLLTVVAKLSGVTPRDLTQHILTEMGGNVRRLPTRTAPTPAVQKRASRKSPRKPKIGDE